MSEFETIDDEDNIWLRKRKRPRAILGEGTPWITWICCTLCGGLFLLIHATGGPGSNHLLEYATYPDATAIWDGAWWGPVTSAFVHFDPLHGIFNIYWLWIFGRGIERHFGPLRFGLLVLTSAFLSSSCQIAFGDNAGIGFSGVNYALFGFLWLSRKTIPDFESVVPDRIVKFMMGWFVLCFFLSKSGIMPVGNAAHSAGLLFGALVGAVFVLRYKRALTMPALAVVSLALLIPAFTAPWSTYWMSHKAYEHHDAGNLGPAIALYDRIIDREPNNDWARDNRELAINALRFQRLELGVQEAMETVKKASSDKQSKQSDN